MFCRRLFVILLVLLAGCQRPSEPASTSPPPPVGPAAEPQAAPPQASPGERAGSQTCRDCHAEFHRLWVDSWHGRAMQPYSAALAQTYLTPQEGETTIGGRTYQMEIGPEAGCLREQGPQGERRYPIAQVMGGKNVYYFLTPLARGRLQVLPLAYDVHKHAWYDMAASGVRHFPDRPDAALDWTDRLFAFNTTCFGCHVSELATNYDLKSDTYHTTWSEPGISCESCHGPAGEHVRVMQQAVGQPVDDIKIIRTKQFRTQQMNEMCATCHAKLVPLSTKFSPGDRFFDHFDLVTLESADFYPDGRDLGENYTDTSWRQGRCGRSGKLDCNHCHTPSGRMRFVGEQANQMCLPCHESQVRQPAEHGHHAPGSAGNDCRGCHMPMTHFAAMGRTDHSMRPPTPATTVAFQSPNACNICHADHDAAWANEWVGKWYPHDYQAETVRRASLVDAARKRQWDRLPEMLAELSKEGGDEVYVASLVRLLGGCDDRQKWPALVARLRDDSPLVRASAASGLAGHLTPDVLPALLAATADSSRLVRIRAAQALAAVAPSSLADASIRANLEKANREFVRAMDARPDDWASHANLGNFYLERRDLAAAVTELETSIRLEPRQIGPLVNAAMAYSNLGQNDPAERCLRRAVALDPKNAAAQFNLGLLLGEQGHLSEAQAALQTALESDPQMAAAAYNLGVLAGEKELEAALRWCQKAHELQPADPKYAYTLAFFRHRHHESDAAIGLLRQLIDTEPDYLDAYGLLGRIYEEQQNREAAAEIYRRASERQRLRGN